MYQKRERFSYVFVRDWNEDDKNYTVKQQDFGLAPQEAKKVRANASLISTAAQYGVPLAARLAEVTASEGQQVPGSGAVQGQVEVGKAMKAHGH